MSAEELRVLVISYFYPPFVAAGASRAGQLVKQWQGRPGISVRVVAASPSDVPEIGSRDEIVFWTHPLEVNALPRVLLGPRVKEAGYGSPRPLVHVAGEFYRQFMNFPDGQIGWLFSRSAILRAAQQFDPHVVVSTSPPITGHLVAAYVARKLRRPWIAEFRDLWTENPAFRRWQPMATAERMLESRLLQQATVVVGVTPGLVSRLARRRPDAVLITNGYTSADYPVSAPHVDNVLLHVGTVAPGYDLETLLAALGAARTKPAVRFIGRQIGPLRAALADRIVEGLELVPPTGHTEALALMRTSWANLAFINRRRGSNEAQPETVPQKYYEYLGAGRPIIAVGPIEGDGAALLTQSGLARFARDANELQRLLEDRAWVHELRPNVELIASYDYDRIATTYLELIDSTSARHVESTRPGKTRS